MVCRINIKEAEIIIGKLDNGQRTPSHCQWSDIRRQCDAQPDQLQPNGDYGDAISSIFQASAKRQTTKLDNMPPIALAAQIILWFVADAVGVSVIWCTMAGYLLMERIHLSRTLELFRHHLFTTALICALGAILYYALTFPMITTLPHGIAVLMGIGIWYLLRNLMAKPFPEY